MPLLTLGAVWGAVVHDKAVLELDDAARVAYGKLRVMRDHDDELILGYLLENIHDLHGGLGVERAGRLVGKQDIRIVHKRAGDGDALHLAAGHLVRLLVELIAETDLSERFGRPRLSLRRCDTRERQRKLDI